LFVTLHQSFVVCYIPSICTDKKITLVSYEKFLYQNI